VPPATVAHAFNTLLALSCAQILQVSKGSMSMLSSNAAAGDVPSRLGRSQPGSPTAAATMTAGTAARAGGLYPADTSQLRDTAPMSALHSWGGPSSVAPLTQLRQQQQQQQQQGRASFGSNTSSTPAGLLISPSVAALANKYATSSVGGSSVGGLSLPEQPSTGKCTGRMRMLAVGDLFTLRQCAAVCTCPRATPVQRNRQDAHVGSGRPTHTAAVHTVTVCTCPPATPAQRNSICPTATDPAAACASIHTSPHLCPHLRAVAVAALVTVLQVVLTPATALGGHPAGT
jgi:hypothetical protein